MRATQPPLPTGVRALPRATGLLAAFAALSCTESAPTTVTQNPDAPPPTRGVTVRESQGLAFVPGRILVQFESGVDEAGRGSIAAMQGGAVGPAIASTRSGRSIGALVSVPAGREFAAAAALSRQPGVVFAEPDWIRTIAPVAVSCDPCLTPDDTYFESKWDLHNDGSVPGLFGPEATGGIDADMDWLEGFDHLGPEFVGEALIGIIDTGIRATHEDICGKVLAARNFITDQDGGTDDHGHGTHVAGIAAACGNNGKGVAGVAYGPNVRLLAAKVCDAAGNCASSDVAEAMMWVADMGANVMNLSLGDTIYSATEHAALQYAASAGVLPVCAAGNDGTDRVLWPAANAECIAVTATDWGDNLASYSTFGPEAELAAPGGDVEDLFLGTSFILSLGIGSDGDYIGNVGTSMATPQVAGLAGLLFALGIPTAAEVRGRMHTSADDLGPSSWDERFGHGRINVFNAVADLEAPPPPPNDLPVASFGLDPSAPGVNETVEFDGSGSADPDGSIVSYAWDFGDGESGSGSSVHHAYRSAGTYTATLTVTDNRGATGEDVQQVVVDATAGGEPTPALHLKASDLALGEGDPVAAWTDPTSGRVAQAPNGAAGVYRANATPGGTPAVEFTGSTYFEVADDGALEMERSLTVVAVVELDHVGSAHQMLVSKSNASQQPGALHAGFQDATMYLDRAWIENGTHSSAGLTAGTFVTVAMRVSVGQVEHWIDGVPQGVSSLGDGVQTAEPLRIGTLVTTSPVAFLDGRVAEVLVFNTAISDQAIANLQFELRGLHIDGTPPPPNEAPTASFGFSPSAPETGGAVSFDGSGSSDGDGSVIGYSWDLGDGSPAGSGVSPTHSYGAAGDYTVTLTVTDDDGATGQTSQVVSVRDPLPPPNEAPTASFGFSPSAPETGEAVSFDGSGSSDGDGSVIGYSWDLGDGSPAGSGVSPTHSYGAAGDYTVTLTVTDDDGATGQTSQVVSVRDPLPPTNEAPTAAFSVSCLQNDCTFMDMSTDGDGSVVAWTWDFGDGGSSTLESPTHTYRHAGTYTVLLTVLDDDGVGDSASQVATVTCATRGNGTRCR